MLRLPQFPWIEGGGHDDQLHDIQRHQQRWQPERDETEYWRLLLRLQGFGQYLRSQSLRCRRRTMLRLPQYRRGRDRYPERQNPVGIQYVWRNCPGHGLQGYPEIWPGDQRLHRTLHRTGYDEDNSRRPSEGLRTLRFAAAPCQG